jgi:hypothetical protein
MCCKGPTCGIAHTWSATFGLSYKPMFQLLGGFPMKRSEGAGLFAMIAALVFYAASLGFFAS